eukprot:6185504-Pleurochrysis_carterae.AAC.1
MFMMQSWLVNQLNGRTARKPPCWACCAVLSMLIAAPVSAVHRVITIEQGNLRYAIVRCNVRAGIAMPMAYG